MTDKINIAETARLAKLSFSAEEAAEIESDMRKILECFSDVEDAWDNKAEWASKNPSLLRDDEPCCFDLAGEILCASPSVDGGYITVPRVVGDG